MIVEHWYCRSMWDDEWREVDPSILSRNITSRLRGSVQDDARDRLEDGVQVRLLRVEVEPEWEWRHIMPDGFWSDWWTLTDPVNTYNMRSIPQMPDLFFSPVPGATVSTLWQRREKATP